MFTINSIIIRLLEGLAVTIAIYLITQKKFDTRGLIILVLSISATFLVLDLFAPNVGNGARQGAGFGLGFQQVAGNPTPMPLKYYNPNGQIIEGMDDPTALNYYGQYNPKMVEMPAKPNEEPIMMVKGNESGAQVPSVILQQYAQNPFSTEEEHAPFPN
jgi:hypothetical protein